MKTAVDQRRAAEVVTRVFDAFAAGRGLLQHKQDLVENQLPDHVQPLSREHSLFLFYTVANDHGVKSSRLYEKAKALFRDQPSLFEPEKIVSLFSGPGDTSLVERTGFALGTRYPGESAKTWYINSVKLLQKYVGDPRLLFRSSSDAPTLLKEITSFRGFGPKIGGMLLRAIAGLGFSELHHLDKVLVPVDIHDSRISFLTGILKDEAWRNDPKFNYYAFVPTVQRMLLDTCNLLRINWLDVDRALWLIGSRGCVTKGCNSCPLQDVCYVGRQVSNQLVIPLARGRNRRKNDVASEMPANGGFVHSCVETIAGTTQVDCG